MNILLCLITLSCFLMIDGQPIAFDRSGLSFYYELINPRWRNHRTRIRAFTSTLGSPVANIRGARSSYQEYKLPSDSTPKAECFYAFESLNCIGMTGPDIQPTTVKCDASANFNKSSLMNVKKFALSDLRLIKYKRLSSSNETVDAKVYLFGQKENSTNSWTDHRIVEPDTKTMSMFSIHSLLDSTSSSDKGLTVFDPECWLNMVHFFMSIRVADQVNVDKNGLLLPVKSIANLHIF
jgi:hypothetical protein